MTPVFGALTAAQLDLVHALEQELRSPDLSRPRYLIVVSNRSDFRADPAAYGLCFSSLTAEQLRRIQDLEQQLVDCRVLSLEESEHTRFVVEAKTDKNEWEPISETYQHIPEKYREWQFLTFEAAQTAKSKLKSYLWPKRQLVEKKPIRIRRVF